MRDGVCFYSCGSSISLDWRWLGDLTTLSVFGQPIVFAHTYEKAVELLDKKSLIYSGRATVQMFALGGLQDHVSELQYGSQLRECRRMLRSEINPVRVKSHHGLQEAMSRRFLRSLLASPEQFYDLIEWWISALCTFLGLAITLLQVFRLCCLKDHLWLWYTRQKRSYDWKGAQSH